MLELERPHDVWSTRLNYPTENFLFQIIPVFQVAYLWPQDVYRPGPEDRPGAAQEAGPGLQDPGPGGLLPGRAGRRQGPGRRHQERQELSGRVCEWWRGNELGQKHQVGGQQGGTGAPQTYTRSGKYVLYFNNFFFYLCTWNSLIFPICTFLSYALHFCTLYLAPCTSHISMVGPFKDTGVL